MSTPHRRRNYFVKKPLQLKIISAIAGTLFAVTVVTALGIYVSVWGQVIESFNEINVSQDLETAKRLSDYEAARARRADWRLVGIFKEAELLSARQRGQLARIIRRTNSGLMPKLIAVVALVAAASLFLSHRIAGPVFRFERSVKALAAGDLTVNFRTRKGDELKGLSGDLQALTDSLRNKIILLRETLEDAKSSPSEHAGQYISRIEREFSDYRV
jgi:methyl-accepting chemotaxis protein